MSDSSPRPHDSDSPDGADDAPLQIALSHLFYAVAVLAAAMATFGPSGMASGTAIVIFWAWVFLGSNRPRRLLQAVVTIFILLFLCGLLLPAVSSAREAARRMQCSNNLKMIGLALHNYHEAYDSLPPAYIADADGRPMHSWRVLILPFMEHEPLYEQYRFDEPWDGPNNRLLADQMPYGFACPSETHRMHPMHGRPTTTSYVAVAGEGTAWPLDRGRPFTEIADGLTNTLLVIESPGRPIEWMEPRDLTVEQAIGAFASPQPMDYGHVHEGFFYTTTYGRNVLLADGSVHFIGRLADAVAEQWVGIDNGASETLDAGHFGDYYRQPNYGNWFRLAIFLLLLFLPLPWVWIRPNGLVGPMEESRPA